MLFMLNLVFTLE